MRPELTALLTLAEEKLRAAGLLVAGGAWGDASSRAYYAAFHVVSAALLSRGETYSRHAQVLGAFNRAFVHTGLFPREFTALLTRLFENRQSGDYDVLPGVTEVEARQDVAHSAKSARDRDRLRQEILERMGWNIYRIWSTDWFSDPEREIEKLLQHIQRLGRAGQSRLGGSSLAMP